MQPGFWRFQIVGWLAYGTSTFLAFLPAVAPARVWPLFQVKIWRTVAGLALSALLREFLVRLERRGAVQRYLAVEQIRFDDQLSVRWSIDPSLEALEVPGFLLQPLVENALRHGRTPGCPLALAITADRDGDGIRIEVANTGTLARATPGTGVGLENLEERLTRLYAERASLRLGVPAFPGDPLQMSGEVTAVENSTVTVKVQGRNSKGVHVTAEVVVEPYERKTP